MSRYTLISSLALFVALGLGLSPLRAELSSDMQEFGWKEFTFDSLTENQFTLLSGDQMLASQHIEISSFNSVSIAYFGLDDPEFKIKDTPYLSFEWRRLGPAIDTDLTKKGGDDRILSVYAAFAYQPEHAKFSEKITRKLVELQQGKDAPGRLLTYLWGGGSAPGQWFENPYTGKAGYMTVLLTPQAPQTQWHSHQVNLYQDFIDRFGHPPSRLLYIAIATDTDDTGQRQKTQIRHLSFTASP